MKTSTIRLAGTPKVGGIRDILEECWMAKVSRHQPKFRSPKKQKLAAIIRAKKLRR